MKRNYHQSILLGSELPFNTVVSKKNYDEKGKSSLEAEIKSGESSVDGKRDKTRTDYDLENHCPILRLISVTHPED